MLDEPEATHKNAAGLFLHQIKPVMTRKVARKVGGGGTPGGDFKFYISVCQEPLS